MVVRKQKLKHQSIEYIGFQVIFLVFINMLPKYVFKSFKDNIKKHHTQSEFTKFLKLDPLGKQQI